MSPCDDGRLQDLLLGGLTLEQVRETQLHLAGCASCRRSIEQFHQLFHALSAEPVPPVPGGIADAVLARLAEPTWLGRWKLRAAAFARRPAMAAGAGTLVGFGIALFQDTLWMLLARVLGGVVSGWATAVYSATSTLLERLVAWTALLESSVHWMVKVRTLVRVLGEAIRLIPAELPLLAAAAGLVLLLVVFRRVVHLRREKLSHAEN
jgi:hypothetical protein